CGRGDDSRYSMETRSVARMEPDGRYFSRDLLRGVDFVRSAFPAVDEPAARKASAAAVIVYYVCAGLVAGALHLAQNPFAAIFLPTPLWELNTALWSAKPVEWIVALLAVMAAAIVFVFLQRQQIQELQPRPSAVTADAHASGVASRYFLYWIARGRNANREPAAPT